MEENRETDFAVPAEKKKKWLFFLIPGILLFLLLLTAGTAWGLLCSFTEKRLPFPEIPGVNAMEQARVMMKIVRTLQNAAGRGENIPKTLPITFTPSELQSITRLISAFGIREEKWGRLFFQMEYLPAKRAFHGKGIFHVNKPFLRERQITADMVFQLAIKEGKPEIRILSLSIGGHPFAGPFPQLEEKLRKDLGKALRKKDVHKFVTSFYIGEKGEGKLTLSAEKFLAGPGKMLLFL